MEKRTSGQNGGSQPATGSSGELLSGRARQPNRPIAVTRRWLAKILRSAGLATSSP